MRGGGITPAAVSFLWISYKFATNIATNVCVEEPKRTLVLKIVVRCVAERDYSESCTHDLNLTVKYFLHERGSHGVLQPLNVSFRCFGCQELKNDRKREAESA